MTYSKLALRNAKRQAKDYLVYFVTVVMAAALLYAFNGLVFSQELQTLSQMMEQLPLMIVMASVVVVCIFGWLVSYSTQFMLSRRSRELGTYILIGLENKQVARLFFLENLVVGGCALVLGIVGTGLLMAGDLMLGIIGAGIIIIFLFGFFLSFASGVPAFFDKRPARKYKGQTLLVFRTLTAKLTTMGIVMAIISMIFIATIISEGSGLVFRGIFEGRANHYSCFDLCISVSNSEQDHTPYLDYIDKNIPVESDLLYSVYQGTGNPVSRFLEEDAAQTRFICYYDTDLILRYSDYVALRKMLGYPEISLESGTYLIHCMEYLEKALMEYNIPITIGGVKLAPSGVYTEPFNQYGWDTNGGNFVLVVPDELVENQPVAHRIYCALTAQPVTSEQFEALRSIRNDDARPEHDTLHGAADEQTEAAAQTAVLVFPLFFLALALTMTAATILTIQQLSETEHFRRQFELLRKLGMQRREMEKALRNQFAIYYAMPALPALLIGAPFIFHLSTLPEAGVMTGHNSPGVITGISLGLFFLIYAVYIILAHISLKRNVLSK